MLYPLSYGGPRRNNLIRRHVLAGCLRRYGCQPTAGVCFLTDSDHDFDGLAHKEGTATTDALTILRSTGSHPIVRGFPLGGHHLFDHDLSLMSCKPKSGSPTMHCTTPLPGYPTTPCSSTVSRPHWPVR
jgi:hypothetical protein